MKQPRSCPWCQQPPQLRAPFGDLVLGCVNPKCPVQPSTFLHGPKTQRYCRVLKAWNRGYTPPDL